MEFLNLIGSLTISTSFVAVHHRCQFIQFIFPNVKQRFLAEDHKPTLKKKVSLSRYAFIRRLASITFEARELFYGQSGNVP